MYNIFKGMTLPCKSQMYDRCSDHGIRRPGQSICLKEGKDLRNPFNRWKWQGSRESVRILGKPCSSHLNNGTPWFQSRGGCQKGMHWAGVCFKTPFFILYFIFFPPYCCRLNNCQNIPLKEFFFFLQELLKACFLFRHLKKSCF